MKPTIVRKIPRADPELIRALGELGVASVHEAQGRTGLLRPYMRPVYPAARAAGSAVTVVCAPGDNLMIHASIEVCQPGDMLVVTTTSDSTDGMFGDLLAVSARAHGVSGLVIDAGVRDTADIARRWTFRSGRGLSRRRVPSRRRPAGSNVPVVCAGASHTARRRDRRRRRWRCRGAARVGRGRGSPRQERVAKEEKTRERLRKGELRPGLLRPAGEADRAGRDAGSTRRSTGIDTCPPLDSLDSAKRGPRLRRSPGGWRRAGVAPTTSPPPLPIAAI